jgi:uncharacterized membrane protein
MSMHDSAPAADAGAGRTAAWWFSLSLAAVGLLDAIYLTYVKLASAYAYCGGFGECEVVNQSRYAQLWGLPIALYGAGAYAVILGLLLLEQRGRWWSEQAPLALFGLTLFGTLFSAYLTYIEVGILRAICPYCVLSAIAMTVLFLIAIVRVRRSL